MPTVFAWNLQSLQGPLLFAAIVTFTFTAIRLLVLSGRRWRALAKRTPRKNPQEYGKLPAKERPLFSGQSLPLSVSRWETEIHELGRQIVGQVETKLAVLQTYTHQADRAIGQMESLLERLQRVLQVMEEKEKKAERSVTEPVKYTEPVECPVECVEPVVFSNVIKATQIELGSSDEWPKEKTEKRHSERPAKRSGFENRPAREEAEVAVAVRIAAMEEEFLDTSLRLPTFPPFSLVQEDVSDVPVRTATISFPPSTSPITPPLPPSPHLATPIPSSIPFTSHTKMEQELSKHLSPPQVFRMDSPHIVPMRPTPVQPTPIQRPPQRPPQSRPVSLSLFLGGKSDAELFPTVFPTTTTLPTTGFAATSQTAKNEFTSGPKPQLTSLLVANE